MNPIYKFQLDAGGDNLLVNTTVLVGYYISTQGVLVQDDEYITSDYLAIRPNTKYYMTSQDASRPPRGSILTFFDRAKNRIGFAIDYLVSDQSPANAAFARLSVCASDFNKYSLSTSPDYHGLVNVYPLRKTDLSKDYELQQNEKFYRAKLSGKLLFTRNDYAIIANARFETKFTLVVSISWNNGQTWMEYWRGQFWKTDCKFDIDAQTAEVTPAPVDDYTDVLAGMEKEYNLIDLKPEIEHLTITKRPLIQMYVPGESVVSCFLSGMYWEQDCDPVTNETDLVNTYHFALNSSHTGGQQVSGTGVADGLWLNGESPDGLYEWTYETKQEGGEGESAPETFVYTYLTRKADNVRLFANRNYQSAATGTFSMYRYGDEEMEPVASVVLITIKVYARYLLDVDTIAGLNTYPIPANDIVENNRNYRRAIGYAVSDVVYYSTNTTATPTEWGIKQPGEYWQKPYSIYDAQFYPIGRSHWGDFSIWFAFSPLDELMEQSGRKAYRLKDAYPLHSVISVLLNKIAPGITHEPTTEYSQFLYDQYNPISGDVFDLYITQKSNILAGDYSQPAQKAPITLKMVTDMLRDCFRAYWYVEDGKFKIEHIQWFKNGGRYYGSPAISHDLTVEKVTRNGKPWAFGTSQYEYNKPTMPERYQFGWMDDVTRAFEGYPIEILSKYVTPGNIEEINVSNFTTDIDYMLLNPGGCSKDGFALMAAISRQNISQLNFIQGGLLAVTIGAKIDNLYTTAANRIRSELLPITSSKITPSSMVGYLYSLIFCDLNHNIISQIVYTSSSSVINVPNNAKFLLVLMRKTDDAAITPENVKNLTWNIGGVGHSLPFIERTIGNITYINQNGLLAFIDLQPTYYVYDLPAYQIRMNDEQGVAYGITREKKQTLRMPVVDDPNPTQLIKTYLGNGQVEKISVNLSSRNANVTLMYDTQNYNE